ncbi:hypothetical protein [[Ruminococcus] torques]|uniref:hypothetical protein n=1 Tax=[Ruminococcus] torques TaxID=33039 RepID=UPI003AF001FB
MLLSEITEKITNEKLKESLFSFKEAGLPFKAVSVDTVIDLYCYLLDTMNKGGGMLDVDGDETSCLLAYGYSLIANLFNEISKGTINFSTNNEQPYKYRILQKTETGEKVEAGFMDKLDAMLYLNQKNSIAEQEGNTNRFYAEEWAGECQ